MKTHLARFFSIGLALLVAAPAYAADKETRQMMADIRMLQEQAQQLQNTVTALAQALTQALTDGIKGVDTRLTSRIDDQAEANRKAFADQKTVTSSISSDVRTLREKMDDSTTRLGSLSLEVQALRELVTANRVSVPPPADAADAGARPAGDASAPPVGLTQLQMGASPTKMWDQAYADYSNGDYKLAIDGFQGFIKSFPTSPQADEAQVMVCSSYLNDGKYPQALDACDTAIRNYPRGNATPDAYYRKGVALQNLKQPDAARDAFEFLVKTYPESDAARLAQNRFPELKKP